MRGSSCRWLRPPPPIPGRTAVSAQAARRVGYRLVTARLVPDPDLTRGVGAPSQENGFRAPAAPARSRQSWSRRRSRPDRYRHGPGRRAPRSTSRAQSPWSGSAMACHVPIRSGSGSGTGRTAPSQASGASRCGFSAHSARIHRPGIDWCMYGSCAAFLQASVSSPLAVSLYAQSPVGHQIACWGSLGDAVPMACSGAGCPLNAQVFSLILLWLPALQQSSRFLRLV